MQSNWNEIVDSFDDMNLREALLRGIFAYGFEKPSAIQQRAIMPCIKGEWTSRLVGVVSSRERLSATLFVGFHMEMLHIRLYFINIPN